jgi:hypothetical protein
MNALSVISYNMGLNIRDFAAECDYLKLHIDDGEAGQQMYKIAQENTAKNLVGRASVYLLQEVDKEDRLLLTNLKIAGYALFHIRNSPTASEKVQNREVFDTAIALKIDEFENVENFSNAINAYDVAIVSATYKLTGERMTFVSGHVPGFNLDEKNYYEADLRDGEKYCRTMIDQLSQTESAIQIIGADMNANPEVLKKAGRKSDRTWTHRFEKFDDAGFEIFRTEKPTNVKPDSDYCKRELDFIFVRATSRTQDKIKSLFKPSILGDTTRLLGWDSALNASDHRPILTQFSLSSSFF